MGTNFEFILNNPALSLTSAIIEKYYVDIANELIAEYDKLAPLAVEKERWFQEQSMKRKAISEVTRNFLVSSYTLLMMHF
jgi:hypothetical protein